MWIFIILPLVICDEKNHKYHEGEELILWFNNLVSVNNPQETYSYSKFPFCNGGSSIKNNFIGNGGIMEGFKLKDKGIEIEFERQTDIESFCEFDLNDDCREEFNDVVYRKYSHQMYIDDLTILSAAGYYDEITNETYLYTHFAFNIFYNINSIIAVKANMERSVCLSKSFMINFTYSVQWSATETKFDQKFNNYLDTEYFENSIHWYSILNSFIMVLLLCALVIQIVFKTISQDANQFEILQVESQIKLDENWKKLSRDVFYAPPFLSLFTFFVSTGWQLALMTLIIILLNIFYPMYKERGSFQYYLLIDYILLGFISGFKCGSIYTEYKGKRWLYTFLLSSLGFPTVLIATGGFINFITLIYSYTESITFSSLLEIVLLIIFVYLPLFAGGIAIGRKYQLQKYSHDNINSIQDLVLREKTYYFKLIALILLGGILPFFSIYVEIYYIFNSLWKYKFYYVYSFTLISFILLTISAACVSIVCTYTTLNFQDHHWHWMSFLSSGSLGIYFFLFSIYFYTFKTQMTGLFQFLYYLTSVTLTSIYLSLLSGSIGYSASHIFINRLYSNTYLSSLDTKN